jgi:hypothetical protein
MPIMQIKSGTGWYRGFGEGWIALLSPSPLGEGFRVRLLVRGIAPSLRSVAIPFGIPATPDYFRLVSLALFFVSHLSSLRQAWFGNLRDKKSRPPLASGSNPSLRREGDSNPRYSHPYGSLANYWFKPLTHLSIFRARQN